MVYDKYRNNLIAAATRNLRSVLARYSFNETTKELELKQVDRNHHSTGFDLVISNDGKHVAFCCEFGNGHPFADKELFDIDSSDITNNFGGWMSSGHPTSADFSLDNNVMGSI